MAGRPSFACTIITFFNKKLLFSVFKQILHAVFVEKNSKLTIFKDFLAVFEHILKRMVGKMCDGVRFGKIRPPLHQILEWPL